MLLLVLFFAPAARSQIAASDDAAPRPGDAPVVDTAVILARRGWHIDIGFATGALEAPLAPLARDFPQARYLFFGFGDLHYLLSKHRHGPVLLAALWPGRALILLTAIDNTPEQAFGAAHIIRLHLRAADSSAIQHFLLGAFRHEEDRPPVRYAPGPYEGSAYYLATAQYSALHTCNTWVAEALGAGGLSLHARRVIFAGQLWRRAQHFAAAQPISVTEPINFTEPTSAAEPITEGVPARWSDPDRG